jgi:hypothetical protein
MSFFTSFFGVVIAAGVGAGEKSRVKRSFCAVEVSAVVCTLPPTGAAATTVDTAAIDRGIDGMRLCCIDRSWCWVREATTDVVVVTTGAGDGEVIGGECGGETGATDTGAAVVEDSAGVLDSNVEGSAGGGPSVAHRRDSYLERMKESILL